MTETSLVHIRSLDEPSRFVGCGVLVEGGLIATCRHVWRDAQRDGAARVVFPSFGDPAGSAQSVLSLVDSCDDEVVKPDLVLLTAPDIPPAAVRLHLARAARYECGDGYGRAELPSRGLEVTIKGSILEDVGRDGRRQFSGATSTGYWFEPGSSGAPLFLEFGQQLAGIASVAEVAQAPQGGVLREAFVVPATTIWRFVERSIARQIAEKERVDVSRFDGLLHMLGLEGVGASDLPGKLEAAVLAMRAHGDQPPAPAGDDDLEQVLQGARDRVGALDLPGARSIVEDRRKTVSEQRRDATLREVILLREREKIERLGRDYKASKATLRELLALDSTGIWDWLALGDLERLSGALLPSIEAFRGAAKAAKAADRQRDLSVALNRLGDVLVMNADRLGALEAFRESLSIAEKLTLANPESGEASRDLSVSYEKVGDILLAVRKREGAFEAFEKGLQIIQGLVDANPGNLQLESDLSVCIEKIGLVHAANGESGRALDSFRESLAIRDRLTQADSANVKWARDRAVSLNKVGDMLMASDKDAALKLFYDGLAVSQRLADADPENVELARDLSISFERVGDGLVAHNDDENALAAYHQSLAIRARLTAADPHNLLWARDRLVPLNRVGDIQLRRNDRPGALETFNDGLTTARRLVASDPKNDVWSHDLSVSLERVGNVLRRGGDTPGALTNLRECAAIRERLVGGDPDRQEWANNLALVSEVLGDVLLGEKDYAGAATSYQRTLDLWKTLADKNPEKSLFARNQSVAFNKMGAVLLAKGRPEEALAMFRDSMAIVQRLRSTDPDNAGWARDEIVTLTRLAEADVKKARDYLDQALAIAVGVEASARSPANTSSLLEFVRGRIAALVERAAATEVAVPDVPPG